MQMSYKTLIKDVRAEAVGEAVNFVKEKLKFVVKEVTKEYRLILD